MSLRSPAVRESDATLLVVASGTLGDILPVARIVAGLAREDIAVRVVTNDGYSGFFPAAIEVISLPFDPGEVIASRSGQRMIEGGAFGMRRMAGLYGVVHPQIRASVSAVADAIGRTKGVFVSGIPFGVGQLAALHDKPVLRVLYQPHWPNWSVKSLYANSAASWPRAGNRASHVIAELTAQALFRRELKSAVSQSVGAAHRIPARSLYSRLLHESYYRRHPTILSLTPSFAHEVLLDAPWAHIEGFIRPASIQPAEGFADAVKRMRTEKYRYVYCGFGSMVSQRTERITAAVLTAAETLGLKLVVQGRVPSGLRSSPALHVVPFGDHRELFSCCVGLVHHGGAGTVVASLDAQRPFVVVPQWADQFFWADRTQALGLSVRHWGDASSAAAWKSTLTDLVDLSEEQTYADSAERAGGYDGYDQALLRVSEFCQALM